MGNTPEKIISQNKTYQIIELLGEGGTSAVYLANDGKREVALKILGEEVDPAFKDKYVQILKNEFEVLSKLRHPNIAEVYDFEFAPDLNKYFFTTEYIKGNDIYNFTEQLDVRAKEELFVQFLTALDYVHRCGVIHCDVKCGNALVTQLKKTSVVKLVDFGFATRRLATSGNVIGTAHYLAPELLVAERKDVDHRIDIYAAGVLFYRLLHRAYPYEADSVSGILKWHRNHEAVPFADDVPDYLRQLILRMIATYPSDRISSAAKAIEFINLRTEGRYKRSVEKMAGLQFKEGPLVGRAEILKKAENVIDEIKSLKSPSGFGLVCIGQQGIGKSRVLKEIKYRAELNEILLKEFVCIEGQNHVEEFIGGDRGEANKSEDKRRLADITWINDFIEKNKKAGAIILIDDIQLSDSAFIKFLLMFEDRLRVNRTSGDIPIGFLIGSRPKVEMNEVIGRWFDRTEIAKLELPNLGTDAIKDYLNKIGVDDPEKHAEAALAFSGGVPGLIEAYAQHVLTPGGSAKPPASLAQSYLDRAKKISKSAILCLDFISVARRNLRSEELSELLDLNKEQVSVALQELFSIGFVNIGYPTTEVKLTNKAIGEVIKGNLESELLKKISMRIGMWLEKTDPGALAEIAEYFSDAEVVDKSQSYAQAAAKKFEETFNNSEAARFYSLALRNEEDENKQKALIRGISRMNILMGNYKKAIASITELINKGDYSLENYRLLGMAHVKMQDFARAKQWYEEGLTKMTEDTDITDLVHFKNSLGNVNFYTGNLELSEKYFTEAIADATECLLFNNNLGLILSAKGNYDQAIKFYDNRKKYLAAKKNKRVLSLCYAECGYINMVHNHPAEAISELTESYKLASEIGDWYNILVIIGNLVRCYQQTAQYSKALEFALKGLEVEGNVGSAEEIAQNHLTIGILYETIGVFDLAKQRIEIARDRFMALGNVLMEGWCHLSLSYIFKDLDKFTDAIGELASAERIATDLKQNELLSWAQYAKADLMNEYGKKAEAEAVLKKLLPVNTKEFELRKRLLELKLSEADADTITDKYEELAEACDGFPELKWEIYSALGEFLEKIGKADWAANAFRHAYSIIEFIANNLSEAYRDSYMTQRFRIKVVQKFKPELASKSASLDKKTRSSSEGKTSALS